MKKSGILIFLASFILIHCGEESLAPPQITIDLSPVRIPDRSIAEEAPPYIFNLMLQNEGEEMLKIDSTVLKGDQNCAFTMEGPDLEELGDNDKSFIRMSYKPSVRGEDNVKLIIESNSTEYSTFVVPICGRGLLPEEIGPEEDDTESDEETEADTEEMTSDRTCTAPPDDQPDCEAADNAEE